MHVLATAGHVDHGKSTLVRLLTGMEPDRWAEERRRGMTIDLGFAWTTVPVMPAVPTMPAMPAPPGQSGAAAEEQVAFVDVPGHERFVPNMLAGVGPVPAVLFVVAADEGWMPQSQEHLEALDALGVRHGLLVVTRSDRSDPDLAIEEARDRMQGTTLADVPAVAVSGLTGAGLPELQTAIAELVGRLDRPDPTAPVRLWVDRSFTIRGSGTVVTGTLAGGTLRVGDELLLEPAGRRVRVRGLQSLGHPAEEVPAVARVAVNLRGVDREDVGRGDALVSPGRWLASDVIDVRLRTVAGSAVTSSAVTSSAVAGSAVTDGGGTGAADQLPAWLVLHAGAAQVPVRVRPLGADTARLSLATPLPLHLGDTALLRDPGAHRVLAGVSVLDLRPAALRRRGAAASRAKELDDVRAQPDARDVLRRRGVLRSVELVAMGLDPAGLPAVGEWLVDPGHRAELAAGLVALVRTHAAESPLEPGLPVDTARQRLGLPDPRLVSALVAPPLELTGGRVRLLGSGAALPPAVEAALSTLERELEQAPFAAPDAARLAALGLGPRELAAAVRAGRLVALAEGVFLLPGAVDEASVRLARLGEGFSVSDARQALDTSRRVAVPLLERLDRVGRTVRLDENRRRVADPPAGTRDALPR